MPKVFRLIQLARPVDRSRQLNFRIVYQREFYEGYSIQDGDAIDVSICDTLKTLYNVTGTFGEKSRGRAFYLSTSLKAHSLTALPVSILPTGFNDLSAIQLGSVQGREFHPKTGFIEIAHQKPVGHEFLKYLPENTLYLSVPLELFDTLNTDFLLQ